jgi:CRP-like cAMP-binding protein
MKDSLNNYLTENSKLSPKEKNDIVDHFYCKEIRRNDFWIMHGEVCKQLAFVSKGIVRIIKETNEVESTVQLVFENSFITSLTSFAYQTKSEWSIQALTDCSLTLIDRDNHLKLIDKYKNSLELDNMLLLQAYTDLEYRLFSQHNLTAEQRFNQLFSEKPEIFNQIPLKYIASVLCIAPETLSRLRKKHLT